MRVAVYYAPAIDDPLWSTASTWLGRNPETAASCSHPDVEGIAEATAEPRRYGFHATLKPPMRLATAYDLFVADARALAAKLTPFELPPLAVQNLRGFLALRETAPSQPLQALADACVTDLDQHRAPPEPDELARRRKHGLTAAQDAMLARWGYPHVLETWFFHMTLTRRLSDPDMARLRPLAEAHFADAVGQARRVEALTIFTQAAPGANFLVAERLPFGSLTAPSH